MCIEDNFLLSWVLQENWKSRKYEHCAYQDLEKKSLRKYLDLRRRK